MSFIFTDKEREEIHKYMKEQAPKLQLLEELSSLEHDQWCDWSNCLADDIFHLIQLIPTNNISVDDFEFVESQLDRIDRWSKLWKPYQYLSEEWKESDRDYARKVLKLLEER